MPYDAMSYDRQVAEIANVNRASVKDVSSGGSFLSKLRPEDKLVPVVTLVIYLGANDWDAPKSLHGLFGDVDDRIIEYTRTTSSTSCSST